MTHIEALEVMLTRRNINFKVEIQPWYCTPQIIVYDENGEIAGDVISHCYSYGGPDGLLEIMGFGLDDVKGWLTAAKACFIIMEHLQK